MSALFKFYSNLIWDLGFEVNLNPIHTLFDRSSSEAGLLKSVNEFFSIHLLNNII